MWGERASARTVIERWMRSEVGCMNALRVRRRLPLAALLRMKEPSCRAERGGLHTFARSDLETLREVLSPEEAERLLLPIDMYVDLRMDDTAYITDPLAAEAIRRLEGFTRGFRYRQGRLDLPLSLAVDISFRIGSVIQMVFLMGSSPIHPSRAVRT